MPCAYCKSCGHNRATCPLWQNLQCLLEDETEIDPYVKPRRIHLCSCCGEEGHNLQTCFQWKVLRCLVDHSVDEMVLMEEKRAITCSLCGCVGHNKRTCSGEIFMETGPVSFKRKPQSPKDTHRLKHVTWSVDTFSPKPSRTRFHILARKSLA
jgi:hypothetical protein